MIFDYVKRLWRREPPQSITLASLTVQQTPPPPPVTLPPPAGKPARPLSSTISKAMHAVSANPSISAAELAKQLKISPSYARTLLRRARSATPEQSEPQPGPAGDVQAALTNLQTRLSAAEKDLAAVRSLPVHARASLNLNRRAEVLRLLNNGLSSESIAERLGVPHGEIEFIRKVDRMLAASA
jgi:DNA-binding CsgD family transcriptional regulator